MWFVWKELFKTTFENGIEEVLENPHTLVKLSGRSVYIELQ